MNKTPCIFQNTEVKPYLLMFSSQVALDGCRLLMPTQMFMRNGEYTAFWYLQFLCYLMQRQFMIGQNIQSRVRITFPQPLLCLNNIFPIRKQCFINTRNSDFSIVLTMCKSHHHDPHVALPAWISLTLSRHPSLSSIAPSKSSRLHPVSAQSCYIYVLAGRLTFAHTYEGVHRSLLLMSSSLLLQPWPASLVHLTWIVFLIGGR